MRVVTSTRPWVGVQVTKRSVSLAFIVFQFCHILNPASLQGLQRPLSFDPKVAVVERIDRFLLFLRSTKWNANLILLRDYAELVALCKVIVWKTHIPVRTQK